MNQQLPADSTMLLRRDASLMLRSLSDAQRRWVCERLVYEVPALAITVIADLTDALQSTTSPVVAAPPLGAVPDGAGRPRTSLSGGGR